MTIPKESSRSMRAVLYGSYPTSERHRIEKFLTTSWELTSLLDDATTDARSSALADADALVTSRYTKIDPPAPKIRLLQCSSTGTDRIDVARLPPGCTLCNLFGQRYYGPVALIIDALCYSTTDIFAAGFQDHEIGPVIGTTTGATVRVAMIM